MACKKEPSQAYKEYRDKYLNGINLNLKTPVDISLELSSLCNLRCGYCYHAKENRKTLPFKRKFMPVSMAYDIITQAANLEVSSLKMNWRGESTLNPHFYEVCAYAKKMSTKSTFIDRLTNSNFNFRYDDERIFQALALQTKVKVSYDSFIPSVFEAQRLGGNHALTTANIEKFYNLPGRDNEIVIQAVRTSANKDEDIESEAKKRWPDATISIRDVVEGRLEGDIDEFKVKTRDHSDRQSCLQAHVRLIFDWDGKASPCCPDIKNQLYLGDIKVDSLSAIFNSEKARQLRESLKDKSAFDNDPCKNCSSFESYKGYKASWQS